MFTVRERRIVKNGRVLYICTNADGEEVKVIMTKEQIEMLILLGDKPPKVGSEVSVAYNVNPVTEEASTEWGNFV